MKIQKNLIQIIAILVIAYFAEEASSSSAAAFSTIDVQITSAEASSFIDPQTSLHGWRVFVVFDHNFDLSKDRDLLRNPQNYKVFNVKTGVSFIPDEAKEVQVPGSTIASVRLNFNSANAFDKDGLYHIYALNLTFGGEAIENQQMLQSPVKIKVPKPPSGNVGQMDNDEVPKPSWKFEKSKDRDDSDIYGSYSLTKSRGSATTGTGDIKVAIPFSKNFWNRLSTFSPVVDVKVSSDEKADPDSLKFAFEWFLPLHVGDNPNAKFPYTAVDWINSGKIEAPKNFDNINALWESRFLFPSSKFPWEGKNFRMFLDPFVGSEVGKNLKSPVREAEGKGVARLYIGANLTMQIPVQNVSLLKGFDFNTSYIRRHLLKRELTFDKNENGDLILVAFGRRPKDYVDSKITFKLNDYFGPFIGFEWGRLPPNYNLVDRKWTFGLLFKTKIKTR